MDVLNRWDNKCARCGIDGKEARLVVHHLEPFSKDPHRTLDCSNAAPFCHKHDKEFHSIYGMNICNTWDFWEYVGDK